MTHREASATGPRETGYKFFEVVPHGTDINFVGLRRTAMLVSCVFILASILLWVVRGGPNYGIDFAGGTMLHLRFNENRTAAQLRKTLVEAGYPEVQLQDLGGQGEEFLLRISTAEGSHESVAKKVEDALHGAVGAESFDVLRSEMVGPKVGKDLRRKAILAVMFSTVLMGLYLTFRFELRFGVGAAVALVHDVVITLGALVLLNYEFNLPVVAGLLTVIGFSVNDTVIVSDRIRENRRKLRRQSLVTIANQSINETLSRTVITSGTSVLVVLALYLLGGSVIHGFAFTLLVGFVVGTYSSIFIATPIVLLFEGAGRR